MSLTVNNPSYDRVYTMYAWRDNNNRLVFTQGEGATTLDGTVTRIKAPRFQLRDDQGVMNLSGSPVISFALTRPDESEDLLACTIIDAANGIVSCPITASATAIAGQAVGEIWVSSTNGTIKFYGVHALIHKGVSDSAAANSTRFSELVEALQKVAAITGEGEEEGTVTVQMDEAIIENGTNPVASGIIYDYLVNNYYTKTQSDNRYYQKSQVYTKAESDASATGIVDSILLGEHDSSASLEISDGELVYVATDGTVKSLGDAKDTFYTKTQMDASLDAKANIATTLAGYGITDGMKYIEIAGNDPTSVDDCTNQNTLYRVYIESDVATHGSYSLICITSSTKKVQYAFTRHGFIIYRGKSGNDAWDDWDYLPTHTQVSKAIRGAVISGFFGIEANSEYDKTYSVHNSDIDSYYNKTPKANDDYAGSYIDEDFTTLTVSRADRPNVLSLAKPTGATKITFRDTVTKKEWSESVSGSSYDVKNLIPNHLYYYTFYNNSNSVLQSGRITTTGQIRMIDGGGDTFNIRDLGGWACDGGTLKYGLIYRGCRLNGSDMTLTNNQVLYLKDTLGIRDEIDLRSNSNAAGITDTALGIGVDYIRKPVLYYQNSISDPASNANYAFLIKRIAQNVKEGKISYIHCSSGADRTGQLCALLEAICGVAQTDLDRDYELTAFASEIDSSGRMNTRKRNTSTNADWKTFIGAITSLDGDGLKDKVIRFLVRNGVTIDEINTLRTYFIDGEPAKINAPYGTATITKTLSNVVMDNNANTVSLYQPFEVTLSPTNSCAIYSVTVTMGGTDVTSTYYSGGRISIPSVTGNITITAVGVNTTATVTLFTALSYGWVNGLYDMDSAMPSYANANTKVDISITDVVYNQLLADGCQGLYVTTDTTNTPTFTLHAIGNTPTANIQIQLVLQQMMV